MLQVTVGIGVPVTIAANCCGVPALTVAVFGLTEIARFGSAIPFPDNGIATEAAISSVTTVSEPVTLPATVGVKRTLKLLDCPAASVKGADIPLRLKPLPLKAAWPMTRLILPVLVMVTAWVALVFRLTLENERLEGTTFNTEVGVASVASAESETTVGVGSASMTSERVPFEVPTTLAVNRTLKLADLLAAMASGRTKPGVVKPEPVRLA